jgi:hypothetical protein
MSSFCSCVPAGRCMRHNLFFKTAWIKKCFWDTLTPRCDARPAVGWTTSTMSPPCPRQLSGTKSPSRSPTPWLCGQTVSTCTDGAGKGSEGVLTLGLNFFSKTSVCDPLPIMKTLSSVTISADYYDSPFRISHNTPCTISNFDLLSNKIIIWHICPLYSFLLALPLSKWSASPTSTARSSCS